MSAKVPADQNYQSVQFYEGGVSISGRGARLSGSFGLTGGGATATQSLGFLTALVVLNVYDQNGNAVSLTLLPDDAEAIARILSGVAAAIEGR